MASVSVPTPEMSTPTPSRNVIALTWDVTVASTSTPPEPVVTTDVGSAASAAVVPSSGPMYELAAVVSVASTLAPPPPRAEMPMLKASARTVLVAVASSRSDPDRTTAPSPTDVATVPVAEAST